MEGDSRDGSEGSPEGDNVSFLCCCSLVDVESQWLQ